MLTGPLFDVGANVDPEYISLQYFKNPVVDTTIFPDINLSVVFVNLIFPNIFP